MESCFSHMPSQVYVCACCVLFKTKGVTPGGVEDIALDSKHQGNIVYLMQCQEAPLTNTRIEVSSALRQET